MDSGEQELDAGKPVSDTPQPLDSEPCEAPPPPEANNERPDVPEAAAAAPVPPSSEAAPQSDAAASDAVAQPSLPAATIQADATDVEGAGDTDTIVESPEDVRLREATTIEPDWQRETSARRIAIELKRVESEVRKILDSHDTRRKRKLMGTRRWRDLEEDMIRWHYARKMDQSALKRLSELVPKRHFLFQRLHFLAGTRVGWNT